ncbi:MAG: hypothetical protein AB7T06_07315 [Kofleriaceae bacterium]
MKALPLSSLILSLSLAACGGGSSSSTSGTTTPKVTSNDPSCPVAVAGTSASVEDSPTGASLVFVTTGDVADVRRRVASMASMHNEHHAAMGPMPDGKDVGGGHSGHDMSAHAGHDMGGTKANDTSGHAGHDMSGHAGHDMGDKQANNPSGHEGHMSGGKHAGHAGGMIGVHSKATVSDVEGGAKIDFVAGSADVAKIQAELRMHAQHFASGTCEMGKS